MPFRLALLASATALFVSDRAIAQQAPASETQTGAPIGAAPPAAASEVTDQDIVVTASRITRDGYTAPTPTIVVGQEFVQQRAITNIGDALNKVPAFRAAVAPSAGGIGNTGAFLADLRGLGPTRTLVLLDRGRLPQTIVPGVAGSAGTTDLNVIPTALIRNSDVVTGGASAAYGSDAVAGVVNFEIDDRFVGLKGSAQYNQTRFHDAKNKYATLAGGATFAGGRGHIVAGFEYNDNNGVPYGSLKRPYSRQFFRFGSITNRPAGTPNNLVLPNFNYFGTGTSGGLILSPGPLQGLAFVSGAGGGLTTATFARGLANLTLSFDVFTPEAIAANAKAGIRNQAFVQLLPSSTRYNAMGKVTFDVSDDLTLYVEPLYSHTSSTVGILTRRDGAGAGPALNIARDNAYLAQALTPAQLALVPAGGLSVGYVGTDFGPVTRTATNELIRVQTGAKGKFGDSWKWDVSYLYGQNTSHVNIFNNFKSANFRNALDAVSVNGQIVCRNAAATAAGCVPVNIFGTLSLSPGAKNYIMGRRPALERQF